MKDNRKYLMWNRAANLIVMLISLAHIPSISKAEPPFSPVSLATGRARVAANDQGAQILSNPAALVHADAFVSSFFFQAGMHADSEREERFTGSMVDNGDDVFFSGGFLYSQGRQSYADNPDYKEKRIQGSFARFIYKQLSFGGSVYYLEKDVKGGRKHNFWDADLGLLWNPIADLGVGARFDSLARHGDDSPAYLRPADRFTLGVNYVFMPQFRARADISRITEYGAASGGKWDVRAGLESFVDAFLVIRMGYEAQESLGRHYASAGFGFVGPRLQIDYAYRKNVDFSAGAMHGVDFRLPF